MDLSSVAGAASPEWIGCAPHEGLRHGRRPLLPDDDGFYVPPPGYEHAKPGTVLRSRDVELGFLGLIPQKFSATQLLYRTTDMHGDPEATVTTVVLPAERDPNSVTPIVSYQCAIDAVASRCFPSYALRSKANAVGALAQFEFVMIAAAVAEGWAVAIPDHEGVHGMWGAPYEPGYRVLDGVRAAQSCERLDLSTTAPVGLWGYSGGGLASAWAAETYGQYAPELNIVGAVLGSPVGDLGHTFRRLNGSFLSGLPALVVAALAHVYPDLNSVIQEYVTDEGRTLLEQLEKMTTVSAIVKLAKKNMDSYLSLPLEDVLEMPAVQHVFDEIKLGTAIPHAPVLVIQAGHDSVIAVEDIDALVETYLAGGADVTYHRDMFSEHILLHPMSAPMALRWLIDRFDGRPLTDHMARTTWPTLLNPVTYKGLIRLGVIAAKLVTGKAVDRRPL